MSEKNWTPGPWRCHESQAKLDAYGKPMNDGVPYEYCITGSNEHGGHVLPILGRTHNWPNNFKANAQLMAAAPELYEALASVISEDGWSLDEGKWLKAYFALAKARGEDVRQVRGAPADE